MPGCDKFFFFQILIFFVIEHPLPLVAANVYPRWLICSIYFYIFHYSFSIVDEQIYSFTYSFTKFHQISISKTAVYFCRQSLSSYSITVQMVLPRKTKSIKIRAKLNNSAKKRKTTITNSKQKTVHTKRKKLTKVISWNSKTYFLFVLFSVWI